MFSAARIDLSAIPEEQRDAVAALLRENAERFLRGFDGILQIDGYAGYNRLMRPSRKGGHPIRVAHR